MTWASFHAYFLLLYTQFNELKGLFMADIKSFASALKSRYTKKKQEVDKKREKREAIKKADKKALKKGAPSIAEQINFGGKYR